MSEQLPSSGLWKSTSAAAVQIAARVVGVGLVVHDRAGSELARHVEALDPDETALELLHLDVVDEDVAPITVGSGISHTASPEIGKESRYDGKDSSVNPKNSLTVPRLRELMKVEESAADLVPEKGRGSAERF